MSAKKLVYIGELAHALAVPEDSLRRDLALAANGSSREIVAIDKSTHKKLGMSSATTLRAIADAAGKKKILESERDACQRLGIARSVFRHKLMPTPVVFGKISNRRAYRPSYVNGCYDAYRLGVFPEDAASWIAQGMVNKAIAHKRDPEQVLYLRMTDAPGMLRKMGKELGYWHGFMDGFFIRDGKATAAIAGFNGRRIERHTAKRGRPTEYLRLAWEHDRREGNRLPAEHVGVRKELKPAHGKTAIEWIRHWLANDPGQDWTYNLLATALHNTWYGHISVMTLNKRVRELLADADDIVRDPETGLISLDYGGECIDSIL